MAQLKEEQQQLICDSRCIQSWRILPWGDRIRSDLFWTPKLLGLRQNLDVEVFDCLQPSELVAHRDQFDSRFPELTSPVCIDGGISTLATCYAPRDARFIRIGRGAAHSLVARFDHLASKLQSAEERCNDVETCHSLRRGLRQTFARRKGVCKSIQDSLVRVLSVFSQIVYPRLRPWNKWTRNTRKLAAAINLQSCQDAVMEMAFARGIYFCDDFDESYTTVLCASCLRRSSPGRARFYQCRFSDCSTRLEGLKLDRDALSAWKITMAWLGQVWNRKQDLKKSKDK